MSSRSESSYAEELPFLRGTTLHNRTLFTFCTNKRFTHRCLSVKNVLSFLFLQAMFQGNGIKISIPTIDLDSSRDSAG